MSDKLAQLVFVHDLNQQAIGDNFTDLEEREAIQAAEIEATENLHAFLAELWKPLAHERTQTAYQKFTHLRNSYIAELSKRIREGKATDKQKASWLLLVFGSDEQADAFMMGTEEKCSKVISAILENQGLWSGKTWVEL